MSIFQSTEFRFAFWSMMLTFGMLALSFFHSAWQLSKFGSGMNEIQKKKYKTDLLKKRIPLIALNCFFLVFINVFGLYFGYDFFDHQSGFSIWMVLLQVVVVVVIDDVYFYFYHRFLHENKWALHHIHGIHHQAITPFPLEYMYVHPMEWFIGSVGPFLGFFVLWLVGFPITEWSFWIYIIVRNLHESDIHSGIPSRIFNHIPFIAPAEHHDLHHSRPFGNYASTLLIWDRLFATRVSNEDVQKKKKS